MKDGNPFSYLIKHSLPKKQKVCLTGGECHDRRELTTLKGTQDPSIQVNSEQVTVVFLSPGDSGETVLSGQNNISKIPSNNRDHISHHQMCKYKNQGFNQPSNFLSLFLPLSLYAPLPSFLSFVLPSYLFVLSPFFHSFNIL